MDSTRNQTTPLGKHFDSFIRLEYLYHLKHVFSVFRTFVLGYGYAPPEHVSMILAILACIGMGIPLLLLIIGGVYMAVKRYRNC